MIKAKAVKYPCVFSWSKGVEEFFVKNDIYLKNAFKIRSIFKPGEKVTLNRPVIVEPYATMAGRAGFTSSGAFSYTHSAFGGHATIGRYCSIAPSSRLMGLEHPLDRISTHTFTCRGYYNRWLEEKFDVALGAVTFSKTDRGGLIIEHDVWIGNSVILRPGVRIGTGAVVAAGSVVVKDVPPFAIVGGNPARIIRYRFDEKTIEHILASAWWRFHVRDFAGLDMQDLHGFLDGLAERIEAGSVTEYKPEPIDIGTSVKRIRAREIRAARLGKARGPDQ